MGKGKKTDVQFVLPGPDPLEQEEELTGGDEYEEPPYTSIEHSTASGEG